MTTEISAEAFGTIGRHDATFLMSWTIINVTVRTWSLSVSDLWQCV